MKRVTKVCFIALALVLMVTPLVACGGDGTTPPPEAGGNQPPVIASLTTEEATVTPNETTKIICDATDPNEDELTYTWETTAGTITAAYNNLIIWEAPGFTGEFTVSVIVDDGQGGSAAKSCTVTVVTNQRPVVSSLTAEPATLLPEETSTITCDASDPDGDELTYTWEATAGTISGAGKIVTWQAPSVVGEFVINVTLDDGKEGGITESSCRILVAIPETTAILTPLASESGSIYFSGNIISAFKIGDDDENDGMRPYFSFDITGLAGAEIQEAELIFTVKEIVGDPWSVSPFLYVEYIDYYEPRPLEPADFHISGYEAERLSSEIPGEVDVHLRLARSLVTPVKPRFQMRLRLGYDNNLNSDADYIEFSQVELVVTYIK